MASDRRKHPESKAPGGFKALVAHFTSLWSGPKAVLGAAVAPGQKRKLTRIPCDHRVDCAVHGKMFSGRVVNISLTGMQMQVTRPVKVGNDMAVKYDTAAGYLQQRRFDIDTVHTRVVWVRRRKGTPQAEIGVTYTDPDQVLANSWIKYALRQLGVDMQQMMDHRKSVRLNARMAAEASSADDEWARGTSSTVLNLGAAGCFAEVRAPFRVQTRIRLKVGPVPGLAPLTVTGRILRCDKIPDEQRWQVAVQFETPVVSQDLLDKYLTALMKDEAAV